MCIYVYFLSTIKSRALHYTIMLYIILSPHDRRQISQSSSSSSFTTTFARSKTKHKTSSLSLSRPKCVFRLFSTIGTKRQTEYVRVCSFSRCLSSLICAFKTSAKCFFFLSLSLFCGSGQKLGFDPKCQISLDF